MRVELYWKTKKTQKSRTSLFFSAWGGKIGIFLALNKHFQPSWQKVQNNLQSLWRNTREYLLSISDFTHRVLLILKTQIQCLLIDILLKNSQTYKEDKEYFLGKKSKLKKTNKNILCFCVVLCCVYDCTIHFYIIPFLILFFFFVYVCL